MFCLHTENPLNKKQVEIEKPELLPEKDMQAGEKGDSPQIKRPVELPKKKSGEEVQLDRPNAGNVGHTLDAHFTHQGISKSQTFFAKSLWCEIDLKLCELVTTINLHYFLAFLSHCQTFFI